jgi:putative ABC transport system permease protein
MQNLMQDLRYGFRTLWQRPGFTAVAAITLALGIGANTALFSVVNGVLLRPLPYPEADRVVMLWEASPKSRNIHVSYQNLDDWRRQSQSFQYISANTGKWGGPETVIGGTEPVRASVVFVFRDFFEVFGVHPVIGRVFMPEESTYGTAPVAVVSYAFWQRSLSADAKIEDRKLKIGGHSFTVIGVMPQGFSYPQDTDVWVSREQLVTDDSARSSHNFAGVARLKPGVTITQAQAEMTAIAHRIVEQDPSDKAHNDVAVISIKQQLTGAIRPALLMLLVAVGFVLLIACANVGNLMLARAVSRRKEIAIRTALGASRLRVVRQLLAESLLLGLLGGVLGLLVAYWLVSILVALAPTTIPRLDAISIDGRTLLFTLGISLLASVLFGLAPALRTSKPNLNEALSEGGRGSTGSASLMRNTLVTAEIALTLVLLIGAGLLVKSFWRVQQVNPGFNSDNLLTMQVSLPESDYPDSGRKIGFYRQLLERLKAQPGIESVAMINELPMSGVDINGAMAIAGRPLDLDHAGYASFRIIGPDYFRALKIPLIKGRYFTEQDNEAGEPVALISELVAKTVFKGEDPIGKRVRSTNDASSQADFEHPERWPKIVGVVGDVKHFGLEAASAATLYVSYMQRPQRIGDMTIVVRGKSEGTDLAATTRHEVMAIDKNLPVTFAAMNQVLSGSTANRRYSLILLSGFAGLALLLATIGIYGVISYAVSQSTREFGIRVALGAQALDVLKLVIGRGAVLAGIGVGIGIAGAFALTRLMANLLFGVTATDPLIFAGVSLLLVVVALLACYLPARRATKVDPLVALRYE